MKNLIYISIVLFLVSCSAQKRASTGNIRSASAADQSPKFLENISISPTAGAREVHKPLLITKPSGNRAVPGIGIEACNALQFKYGILMNQPVENLWNEKLLFFLDEWYGIPYRYGGSTKQGIDCSAFTCQLLQSVYGINVPRTSRDQYASAEKVSKQQLEQGDLVFFNTTGRVSHVGLYLGNNKFVHASTSSGVMISDLNDSYFSRRFAGSGRVR